MISLLLPRINLFYAESVFLNKEFFEAPTGGVGSSCKSCAHCPWMGLNSLHNLDKCVLELKNEIQLDESLIQSAKEPLDKMIQFNA